MSRFTLQRSSRRAVLRLLRWCLLCAALFGLSGVCDIGAYAAVAMPGMSATRTASSSAHPAAGAPASATISLTPQEAKQALDVLNDPRRRAQIEDPLRAVAAAGALAAPPAAAASAPAASSASAASAAAPASAAASTIRNAFTSNGLVAQLVRHGAQALNGVGQDLRRSVATLLDLSSVRSWWSIRLTDPQQRAALLHLAFVVFGTLVPALLIEWLTRRSLRRPRFAVAARGMEGQPEDAAHDGVQAQAAASGDAAGNTTSHATSDAANAVRPAVSAEDAEDAEASAAAGVKVEAQADAAAARTEATAQEQSRAEATPEAPTTLTGVIASHLNWSASVHHWTLLRRLPSALLFTLLEIVPLIAFVAVSGLLASLLTDDGTPADLMLGSLIDVYVFCRAVEIVSAFFLAPSCPRLRLLRMRDRWAVFLQRWVLAIVCVSGAGVALANAAQPIGLTDAAHLAILKAVTFVGHLLIAIMILQCRVPVAARLRSRSGGSGALALFGNWVADVWAIVAVFVVMALWFVWALDVRNGYRTLIHLGGLSLVILICARVAAIVAFGALGRVFQQDDKTPPSIVRKRAARYYPLMRRTVSTAIAVVTLFVLLEVWGLHISQAFAADAVGHRLLSAVVTIVVAAAVALFVWEAVNAAAERKLDVWTTGGDYVRAARLRTLLPMLRTALFVVIALVVVLTGLSELGVNTAPLLAGASIFGVALGFGSQKLVQDFITGIFLLMENAMQVGDWVTLAGVSGTVEYLSIRTVRLRGGDGSLYTVPFSSVSTVNNTNRGIGNAAVKVVIAFGQDVELAAATLKEIGASLREDDAFRAGILNDFAYWGVDQVDGAGVTLVGQIQCKDSARWGVQREFNRRVFARFRERGIELLNPQRNNVLIAPGSVSRFGRDDVEDVDDHEAHDDRGATRGRGDDDDGGPGGAGNGNGNGNGGKSGKRRDGDRDPRPPSRRTN